MTQEEKQLLMRDLCARLPYKTKVRKHWMYQETDGSLKEKESDGVLEINDLYAIWENKPYLRSMSSMTDEECEEVGKHITIYDTVDWMNKHHFDYRGLIEKGLALEAPEGMYKTE